VALIADSQLHLSKQPIDAHFVDASEQLVSRAQTPPE
jgi:hypothetical protein